MHATPDLIVGRWTARYSSLLYANLSPAKIPATMKGIARIILETPLWRASSLQPKHRNGLCCPLASAFLPLLPR